MKAILRYKDGAIKVIELQSKACIVKMPVRESDGTFSFTQFNRDFSVREEPFIYDEVGEH